MAKKVPTTGDWFIPLSDDFQNDDRAATAFIARKLVDNIFALVFCDMRLKSAVHDEVVRLFITGFNSYLRELGQLLDRDGDKLVRGQYPHSGVDIGRWFGRSYAELAWKMGKVVQVAMLLITDPDKGSLAIGKGSDFVAVDPDAAVNAWKLIQKKLEKSYDKSDVQRLKVALKDEQERLATESPTGDKPTDPSGAKHAEKKEHSPWIGSPEMISLMKSNGIKGTSDRSIGRKKMTWRAESQAGTNNQLFRFKLSMFQELGIKYPSEWDNSPD